MISAVTVPDWDVRHIGLPSYIQLNNIAEQFRTNVTNRTSL